MANLDEILIPAPVTDDVLDWPRLFGNDHPVEMEIGCGKGGFLLRVSRQHPERNYLGVEWARPYAQHTADRLRRWGVANVRIMRADARELMLRHIAPASLAALHIYHPDPWPKRRHHKRRLIQPDFVDAVLAALKPGARWALQTDHADYYEHMCAVINPRADLEPIPFDDPDFGVAEDRIETNYERKYLLAGLPIHRLAFRRR